MRHSHTKMKVYFDFLNDKEQRQQDQVLHGGT